MMAYMWNKQASEEILDKVVEALGKNGIEAEVLENKEAAKKRVLELIPEGAEVMDMTSVTLTETGIAEVIEQSGKYDAVKVKLFAMNRATDGRQMQKLGAAPEYAVGSVHAITEDGQVVVVSNTGSQLPAYAYGSDKVIWVVGAQKIVKNLDEAMKRIYDYVLPKESERARKAYGVPGSNVSKILIINKENKPGRIKIILVKEVLGY